MTNFSIIIPHKNIPDLLQNCLNSIPQRDDVQVIVVDDDSDGKIVDFEHFPGLGRKNTEVYFTKEGKGAGYARNVGMRHATGKWLVFADADDTFNDCFDEAMTKYCDCDNDVIFFKVTNASYTNEESHRGDYINECVDECIKSGNYEKLLYVVSNPIAKFVKRELVLKNKIEFEEIRCANDVMFALNVGLKSANPLVLQMPIYCIYLRENSLEMTVSLGNYRIRFNVKCIAYQTAKKINKHHLIEDSIDYWWRTIYDINKIKAIVLIPKIIRICGYKYYKSMNVNIMSDCRRDFLHKLKVGMPNTWGFFKKIKDKIVGKS